MSNFRDCIPTIDGNLTQQSSESEMSHFRRRILTDRHRTCPRRYVMASLLAVLLVIEETRVWSIIYSTADPPKEISTVVTLKDFWIAVVGVRATINFLGGVLIFFCSSHRFLFVTVTASSILHALIPNALKQQSNAFLLTVIIGQEILAAPIRIAVLSMWKDWAPPDERTRLVTISFLGIAVEASSTLIIAAVSTKTFESINYSVGIVGIAWAIIWYNITSTTPQSDPLITEKEYLYIKSKMPSHYQAKTRLKDIPWKRIYKSKQLTVIEVIFLKLGSSIEVIKNNGLLLHVTYDNKILILFFLFMAYFIFVFIGSSFLMDYLLKKHRVKALMIRKFFLCSGFVLHSAILLGTKYVSYSYYMAVASIIAHCGFALSIPGILRYPMDVSPRYVSIISGVAFGSYHAGQLTFMLNKSASLFDPSNRDQEYKMIITESFISLIAAIVFLMSADTEEQSWSFPKSSQRGENDYTASHSYPEPSETI